MSDMTTHLDGDILPLGESETKDGVAGAEFIGLKREERRTGDPGIRIDIWG